MSTTYINCPYILLDAEPGPSHGVGDEAKQIKSFLSKLTESFFESISLGKSKKDALKALDLIFSDSCKPDWDGYGAASASYESYLNAKRFIQAMPTNLPMPEIAVDPDGAISLEWYRSPRRVFSVSIGINDELVYAGIFGVNKTHGTEAFNTAIPRVVLDNIRRLTS